MSCTSCQSFRRISPHPLMTVLKPYAETAELARQIRLMGWEIRSDVPHEGFISMNFHHKSLDPNMMFSYAVRDVPHHVDNELMWGAFVECMNLRDRHPHHKERLMHCVRRNDFNWVQR